LILIVEDDEDIRRTLTEVLNAEGYATREAANGRLALDLLGRLTADELPKCILLDLMMPVMDGVTFLATLRRDHAAWAKIPVIVNTAKGGVALQMEDWPGALDRLQKPVDIDELYEAVAKYVVRNAG